MLPSAPSASPGSEPAIVLGSGCNLGGPGRHCHRPELLASHSRSWPSTYKEPRNAPRISYSVSQLAPDLRIAQSLGERGGWYPVTQMVPSRSSASELIPKLSNGGSCVSLPSRQLASPSKVPIHSVPSRAASSARM